MVKLVIVESPAKAKTIGRILGKNYVIKASMGHVRDLPDDKLGILIDEDFQPVYRVIPQRRSVVKEIKELANSASAVYLATDPDREGEAIAWHLIKAANLEKDKIPIRRVTFHEITKEAVEHAFESPRSIDMNLVDAQQARRVLDRLVGYKLSPLLWRKVLKGLSAGRVQSAAVRLVVDREREIESFIAVEYWTIEAELMKRTKQEDKFRASFIGYLNGTKLEIAKKEKCEQILSDLRQSKYSVEAIQKKEVTRQPAPPFITSTLQQEASRKLRFIPKKTMFVAQQLYEGLPIGEEGDTGLITYMRTDSTNVASSAIEETRDYISKKYGEKFMPPKPRVFGKKVKLAQEAHEAIRPTSVFREPEALKQHLNLEQFKLYELIWKRAMASQMSAAIYDTVTVDVKADCVTSVKEYLLQTNASALRFPGFMTIYIEGKDDDGNGNDDNKSIQLPGLTVGEKLNLIDLFSEQNFTQPPPRYTEATLIKALEQKGIGRPSTYAPIISTVLERGYVYKENGKLRPEDIGIIVNDLLVTNFSNIVDFNFTAKMEDELDDIAKGRRNWISVIDDFFSPFNNDLLKAQESLQKIIISSDEKCPECGKPMVLKSSRFGKFLACSDYPNCKGKKTINVNIKAGTRRDAGAISESASTKTYEPCPVCGKSMVIKMGRYGKFMTCSDYPNCKGKKADLVKSEETCPECGKPMVVKSSRFGKFLACSNYPNCRGRKALKSSESRTKAAGEDPSETQATKEACPECGKPMVIKSGRFGKFLACSDYPTCKTTKRLYKFRKTTGPRKA